MTTKKTAKKTVKKTAKKSTKKTVKEPVAKVEKVKVVSLSKEYKVGELDLLPVETFDATFEKEFGTNDFNAAITINEKKRLLTGEKQLDAQEVNVFKSRLEEQTREIKINEVEELKSRVEKTNFSHEDSALCIGLVKGVYKANNSIEALEGILTIKQWEKILSPVGIEISSDKKEEEIISKVLKS